MNVRGILFDAGDTLYGPIGGRWNPRFDFEEVLLRYHPEVPVDRFAEAIAVGKRFMDRSPSTPPRDDYHRVILSELDIRDPSSDLLTDLNRPLDVPVLRQNLIPTPNASHWSHITPVNMLYPASPSY